MIGIYIWKVKNLPLIVEKGVPACVYIYIRAYASAVATYAINILYV